MQTLLGMAYRCSSCSSPFLSCCPLLQNAKENEPFFLGIATAVAIAGNAPAWGASALYLYCASRFAHAVLFLVDFPEVVLPYQVFIRATPYLVGVFTMFSLAGTRLGLA